MTLYAIALGSNRRSRHGSPSETLRAAMVALPGEAVAVSRIRTTPALGPAGRGFANAVLLLESELEPGALLLELKALERDFGRRAGRRWGPRVLDLDIILSSDGFFEAPGLVVPHPSFRGRGFVLAPLAEIAPGWRDPVSGLTIRQLEARLSSRRPVDRHARRS